MTAAPAAPELADPDATPAAQRARFATVARRLATSRLVRAGGLLRAQLVGAEDLTGLVADAEVAHAAAAEAKVLDANGERGDPDRWLESATGGLALDAFATSERVLGALREATGLSWVPAGPGSWSYYRREGHHLGLHRDLAVCDLAVITCVTDRRDLGSGPDDESGALRVWPTRAKEPLHAIRARPAGGHDVRLRGGESVLLLGGLVPHRVLPLHDRHLRIVAPLCYQVAV